MSPLKHWHLNFNYCTSVPEIFVYFYHFKKSFIFLLLISRLDFYFKHCKSIFVWSLYLIPVDLFFLCIIPTVFILISLPSQGVIFGYQFTIGGRVICTPYRLLLIFLLPDHSTARVNRSGQRGPRNDIIYLNHGLNFWLSPSRFYPKSLPSFWLFGLTVII